MTASEDTPKGTRGDLDPVRTQEQVALGGILLDVREPDEFAAGHAPGALHVPLGELESRLSEIEGAGTVFCICRSGGRSAIAADALCAQGLDATNVLGGMQAWASEGLEVIDAAGAPGVVI